MAITPTVGTVVAQPTQLPEKEATRLPPNPGPPPAPITTDGVDAKPTRVSKQTASGVTGAFQLPVSKGAIGDRSAMIAMIANLSSKAIADPAKRAAVAEQVAKFNDDVATALA